MKTLISFITISIINISAFACPNLSGKWLCDDSSKMVLISQTLFGVERLTQINDYETPDEQSLIYLLNIGPQKMGETIQSGICGENSVTVNIKEYLNSKKEVLLDVTYSFILYNENSLIIDVITSNDELIDRNAEAISCKQIAP